MFYDIYLPVFVTSVKFYKVLYSLLCVILIIDWGGQLWNTQTVIVTLAAGGLSRRVAGCQVRDRSQARSWCTCSDVLGSVNRTQV